VRSAPWTAVRHIHREFVPVTDPFVFV
jgi:hypothetical protein